MSIQGRFAVIALATAGHCAELAMSLARLWLASERRVASRGLLGQPSADSLQRSSTRLRARSDREGRCAQTEGTCSSCKAEENMALSILGGSVLSLENWQNVMGKAGGR